MMGFKPIYKQDIIGQYADANKLPPPTLTLYRDDEIIGYETPTSTIIVPLIAIMLLSFILFEKELRPVNRHWVKKKIIKFKDDLKWRIKENSKQSK